MLEESGNGWLLIEKQKTNLGKKAKADFDKLINANMQAIPDSALSNSDKDSSWAKNEKHDWRCSRWWEIFMTSFKIICKVSRKIWKIRWLQKLN